MNGSTYSFTCPNGHLTHSCTRTPRVPECPTCGEQTSLVPEPEPREHEESQR